MKHKGKFLNSFKIILLVILSVVGYLTIWLYYKLPILALDPIWATFLQSILPDLFATILVGLIVTLIWGIVVKFEKSIEDEELKTEISNIVNGLRQGDINNVFEKASIYIEDCSEILVIGTAKQYEASKFDGVKKYLKSTLKRIKNKKELQYKRITALNLNTPFKQHLENCLKQKGQHDIKLMFLEDFSPAYTYLIIDQKFLMVSLTRNGEGDVVDRFCLYTEYPDSEIINEFKMHFDRIWAEEVNRKNRVVTQFNDFEYVHGYQSQAAKYIKKIKDEINQFPPNERIFAQEHALHDLKSLSENFKFYKNVLKVEHMTDNENMISIFINYLSFLKQGDQYKTITFCSFWQNIIHTKNLLYNFINANKKAVGRGAIVERLLVIDLKKIDEEDIVYIENLKAIIENNLNIKKEFSEYQFRILFSTYHSKYEQEHYNFAIITSNDKKENIVFNPIRNNLKNIESTEIIFEIEESKLHTYQDMQERLIIEWQKQDLNQHAKRFIKNIIDDSQLLKEITGQRF